MASMPITTPTEPAARIAVWPQPSSLGEPLVRALNGGGCEIVTLIDQPARVEGALAYDLGIVVIDSPAQQEPAWALARAARVSVLLLARDRDLQLNALNSVDDKHDAELRDAPVAVILARLGMLYRRQQVEWQRRQVEQESQRGQEIRDPLTGLHNRKHLSQQWAELQADGRPTKAVAVLMDLDHFKAVNDRYGHMVGDEVITTVARRLISLAGPDDLLVRMGGDEFVWVFFGERVNNALEALAQARAVIAEPMDTGVGQLSLTVSAGWDHVVMHEHLHAWLERIDKALYAAKSQGRNCSLDFASLHETASDPSELQLRHFQNVAKVASERTAHMLSIFSEDLVRDARRAAEHDSLTQVYNRGYFDRRFERELSLARQQGTPLSVVVFDLDNFGHFNREHGMPTADAVLQAFCRLTATCIRATDWFSRYGGEEFVLVVRGPLEEARLAAERVRAEFEVLEIVSPTGQRVRATVSAGVVEHGVATSQAPSSVIEAASKCLQQAKRAGRNRVHCMAAP